jgi:hypothetical protein
MLLSIGRVSTGGNGLGNVGLNCEARSREAGLVRGLDIVGVRDLGDGEPLLFKLNNMFRDGRRTRRFDGDGGSSSSGIFGLRPSDKVRACFFREVGVDGVDGIDGVTFADEGKATLGADREPKTMLAGNDEDRAGCLSIGKGSWGALSLFSSLRGRESDGSGRLSFGEWC